MERHGRRRPRLDQATTPVPTIVGSPGYGGTITAGVGTWGSGVTTHYVWKDGSTVLATDGPLALDDPRLVGRTITLAVTGSKPGFADVTKTATTVVQPATLTGPTPAIAGSPSSGRP